MEYLESLPVWDDVEHNSHYWYFNSVQHKLITRFIPGKYHQYNHAWMPDWTERNSSSALCVSSVPCLWKSHSLSAAVFKTALKTCLRLTTASKLSVPSTFSCKYTTVGQKCRFPLFRTKLTSEWSCFSAWTKVRLFMLHLQPGISSLS